MLDSSRVATKRPGLRSVAAAADADVAAANGDEGGVPALETGGRVVNVARNLQTIRRVNAIELGIN